MKKEKIYIHLNETIAVRLYGASDPIIRLICFSPMGLNSTHYSQMAKHLPPGWQLCAVDPPGHGQAKGRLIVDFDSLIALYLENLEPWLTGNCFIFGHSLGGLIGFVLTQMLEEKLNIAGIFISSTAPPHRIIEEFARGPKEEIADKEIIEYLINIDPRYEQLTKSLFFLYFKPVIKADYKVFRSFNFNHNGNIKTPLYIIYSPEDDLVDKQEVKGWINFGQSVLFIEVPGKHNNITTHSEIIMKKIKNCIDSRLIKN